MGDAGKSKLPRISFEVTSKLKKLVDAKVVSDGTVLRDVGTQLMEGWINGRFEIEVKETFEEPPVEDKRKLRI